MSHWMLIIADAAPQQGAGEGGGFLQLLIVFGPMIAIFLLINYFLVTRPQQRQQDRHSEMLGRLKKNDRVLTAGGIIGTFVSMSEDKSEVTLRVDDNSRLKFRAEYVRGVLDGETPDSAEGAKSA
ncbi:MAG: preprotein translocase subunit YajC [Planctomycetaceae bacterium]|nr:preprotein translocase subunit YajC [Planctomycetaceae bacterium]